jgi:large subunit ribosomal protein L2
MPIKSFRPITPAVRYKTVSTFSEITKSKPEKKLVRIKKRSGGRNAHGRITARGIGGGHKQKIRTIDFKRKKHDIRAEVLAIEYDPIRTANIALLKYSDGEKRYIIAPHQLAVGSTLMSGEKAEPEVGNALPLSKIPLGMLVHNIELLPGKGGQMVRAAGAGAILMSRDEGLAQLKLPSGEIRKVLERCYATIGEVGNQDHEKIVIGKAGRSRHMGRKPLTRAVAKNPVDHPMGGGEGKTSGGGHPVTPWGVITRGFKTRKKYKHSNRLIVLRRDGKPLKKR